MSTDMNWYHACFFLAVLGVWSYAAYRGAKAAVKELREKMIAMEAGPKKEREFMFAADGKDWNLDKSMYIGHFRNGSTINLFLNGAVSVIVMNYTDEEMAKETSKKLAEIMMKQ